MNAPAFTFPDALLAQHIAIVGKVGSGKTYTGKGMVERLLAAKRRVCILDPTGVWWGLRSSASGTEPGFPIAVFGGPHADVSIAAGSGAALARIIATKNLPAIVDLSELLIGDRHRFATDFAEALYRHNRAPLHLVVDEADEFAPQNPLPETKRMLHHFDRIVRRGRVFGFRVMLITQRPAVLHKNVLTQANTLIAMRLTAPQDREAMRAWIKGQADLEQGEAVLDSLPRLATGEGWLWAPELGLLERTTFPLITTFDSSRTPEDDEVVLEATMLAAVDLGEIQASIAADVVELEQAAAKGAKAAPGPTGAEIERRILDAVGKARFEWDEERRRLVEAAGWVLAAAGKLQAELGGAPAPLREAHADLRITDAAPGRLTERRKRKEPPVDRSANLQGRVDGSAKLQSSAATPAAAPSIDGLKPSAVKILQQLAARAPAGYSRSQVGQLTGFTPSGGTFGQHLAALKNGRHIEDRAGLLHATDSGIKALGADVPRKPKTHPEAMALWQKAMRATAFAMLQAIVAAGKAGINRAAIAAAVGMQASGGTFGQHLSVLRRNGLVTATGHHFVANDILFPERK